MTALSIIGIAAAIVLLAWLGSKGWNLILITLLCGALVAACSGYNPIDSLTTSYLTSFGGAVTNFFLLMVVSAIFGALMSGTGAAKSIANACMKIIDHAKPEKRRFWVIMTITLIGFILGYGGINNFVIMFALVGINKEICKKADVPWHLSMLNGFASGYLIQGFLPGSPSIQNLLPIKILGTTATAGAGLGLICSAVGLVLWLIYVNYELRRCKDEGFMPTGAEIDKTMTESGDQKDAPNVILALIPSVGMLLALNVLKLSPVASMLVGIALSLILFWKRMGGLKEVLKLATSGIQNGSTATLFLAACMGFGAVVSSTIGYGAIMTAMSNLKGPVYWQWLIATAVSCAACGSGSGGLGISLNNLSAQFIAQGANPAVLHRLGTMACCTLDTLPQNSTVFNAIAVNKLEFKKAYRHIFVNCCVLTTIGAIIGTILATFGVV